MTLKEKMYFDCTLNTDEQAEKNEKIADEYAIEFKEWSSNKYKFLKDKGWFQTSYELEMGIFSSTKELLEIFKKEIKL